LYDTTLTTAPAAPAAVGAAGAVVKVVSYNLYWWNAFGQNRWSAGENVLRNIRDVLRPDAMGSQECEDANVVQQASGLLTARNGVAGLCIFADSGVFTVTDTGIRDLQAQGKWGPRYAAWARLTHKTSGRSFWHFNTHWCVHSGNGFTCTSQTRLTGSRNMLSLIQEKAGVQGGSTRDPVVITGDFNAFDGYINEGSLQNFVTNGFSLAKSNWVDFIFFSTPHFRVAGSGVGDPAGSDHPPVFAELEFM